MLEVWEPAGWSPRRKAGCPGTSEPRTRESAAPLPPSRCPPARPAAHANTSGARGSRSGKARGYPHAPGRPLGALPDAWPAPGGAASKEAAALQPEMLGPGAALPASHELLAAGASSGSLCLGTRPTRAEVAEKEARARAGLTDRHAGQWEAGSWRGARLRPGSALDSVPLGVPSCAWFLGVNCSGAACIGSRATPSAGGGTCFGGAG